MGKCKQQHSPREASTRQHGAPHDEGHEGHEGHEGKEGQQNRQGQDGPGCGLPRLEGEDRRWPDQGHPRQEQVWQDCFQGRFSPRQEGLRHQRAQGLVLCCQGGPESPEPHWLCRRWWQVGNRQGALRQGQGPAQVKEDAREGLLLTLGFKHSTPPSWHSTPPPWVSRGETACRWRLRCKTLYIV